ncbi:MAG: guanylate kinase [Pseudomonadota bacterium]
MNKKGRLIIISAPSGTGKTSVIQRFLFTHPHMMHSVSCTTRSKRGQEVDGKDYHFIDELTFKTWIKENKFAEWAKYCGHIYGTLKEPLDKAIEQGKDVLLDLEVIGGTKLKDIYQDKAISIFLLPPSDQELRRRLSQRKTDSEQAQQARLKTALMELTYKDKYDYQVINDDLERACQEIEDILSSRS